MYHVLSPLCFGMTHLSSISAQWVCLSSRSLCGAKCSLIPPPQKNKTDERPSVALSIHAKKKKELLFLATKFWVRKQVKDKDKDFNNTKLGVEIKTSKIRELALDLSNN